MIIKDLLEIKISYKVTTDDNKVFVANVFLCQFNCTGCTIIIIWNNISDLDAKITSISKIIFDDLRLEIE